MDGAKVSQVVKIGLSGWSSSIPRAVKIGLVDGVQVS